MKPISRAEYDRELVKRRGFKAFVRLAWSHIRWKKPGPLVWDWHIEEQANHWEALFRGWIEDLCINVPPGHTKTMLALVLFPAWIWTEDNQYRTITLSYDKGLAEGAAKQSLSLVTSKWYQACWGDRVKVVGGERSPVGTIVLESGGSRFTTFMGGPGTGQHAHMMLADDPLKAQHASGKKIKAALETAKETLASTFGSRRIPGSNITFKTGLVMQRLHQNDPSQAAIERGATHLMLPVKFEPERRCKTVIGGDRRTVEGELLAPKAVPEKEVRSMVRRIGRGAGWESPAVQSQLQQRPAPPGGTIFKGPFRTFTLADVPFKNTDSVLSVDCSFKDGASNDFVGLEVWGTARGHYYLYFSGMRHLGFWDTMRWMADVLRVWPCMSILIEDAANGTAIIETLTREFGLVNVIPEPTYGGSAAKAEAAGAYYQGGRVLHLADGPWLAEKNRNLIGYPSGVEHDDDTSATGQAIMHLAAKGSNLEEALEGWKGADMIAQRPSETATLPAAMFAFTRDKAFDPARSMLADLQSLKDLGAGALDPEILARQPKNLGG